MIVKINKKNQTTEYGTGYFKKEVVCCADAIGKISSKCPSVMRDSQKFKHMTDLSTLLRKTK